MKKLMPEDPSSRRAEGKDAGEQHGRDYMDRTLPVAEAKPVEGYDTVKAVNRDLPAFYPETARRANNKARDARTNLGRTTWSTPTSDDKNS